MTAQTTTASHPVPVTQPTVFEAWQMVTTQLRLEMRRAHYETWVETIQPLGYADGIFRLGVHNAYARDWVDSNLGSRILRLLEPVLNQRVQLTYLLIDPSTPSAAQSAQPAAEKPANRAPRAGASKSLPSQEVGDSPLPVEDAPIEGGGTRKVQLQRAYGSARARVIQPERGLFLTMYLFNKWLPLLGHSAFATILAARSLCYWNPMTGELRNIVETEMGELARRANVSVRTVKDVLAMPLIRDNFLRYKVRRVMTVNGVRTAGILLQVRMDDPLTPEDQEANQTYEEEHWYAATFEGDED